MTRARFLAGAAALAVTLAGCTVGPNYQRPEQPVPAAFVEPQAQPPAGQAIDPAHWWSAFGDAELDRLIERGLRDSPDIRTAASRIRQARYGEIIAGAADKPQLNADASANRIDFSKNAGFSSLARAFSGGGGGSSSPATTGGTTGSTGVALPGNGITTFAVGFDASWELDLFGGARRQREQARAQLEAVEWNRRDAAVTLAAEVAQAYFALRLDQDQIAIINDEIARQQRNLEIAGNQALAGLSPQIDVTRQRASLTSTQARLEPIRADVQLRIHSLGVLLGQTPEALVPELSAPAPALGPTPVVPAGLPSDLLRRRPDVRAAERQLAAATAGVGIAVSDLYPKLSLTGTAQLISTALGNLFSIDSKQTAATASAMFPIIDWGRRRATVNQRREDREQAYIQYQSAVLGALRDVEDSLAQIDAERRRNAALRRAVADALEAERADEAQYRTGLATQSTLLQGETDVLTAREQVASSDAQVRQMTASLFKALGGGWETLPEVEDARHRHQPLR